MNIGIVSPEYPPTPGGVGQSVQRIAKGIASIPGWQISVIVPEYRNSLSVGFQSEIVSHIQDGSINVYYVKPSIHHISSNLRDQEISCFEWICNFTKAHKIDLLHSFYISHTGFITGLAARISDIPFIASIRGNDIHRNIFDPYRFEYINWTLKNANLLTFVAASLQHDAAAICPLISQNRIIWNCIDPTDFNPNAQVRSEFQSISGNIIGMVGDFRQKKGLDKFLEACNYMSSSITILLIGDFNHSEREYWEICVLPYLPENIRVLRTGIIPHSDILAYYLLTDIMIFPSTHDGCPNTFLEAMLAKKPIICSDAGAMGDILSMSQCGILIDPTDPKIFAQKIELLLSNKKLRVSFGNNGHKFICKNLTLAIEKENWFSCYQDTLHAYNNRKS